MKMILLITFITFSCFTFSQSSFYVQKDNNIIEIENEDPYKLDVKEWQIRLYKKGQPTKGNLYWATIKGSTIDVVNKSLRISQEFELKSNEFFGKGRVQNDVTTNFNPFGPIAIIDSRAALTNTDQGQYKISELSERTLDAYETYKEVKDGLDIIIKGEDNLYGNIGNNFKEYTDNLREVFTQISSLQKLLNNNTQQYIDKINQSIKEIDKKLDKAENNALIIKGKNTSNTDAIDTILKKELAKTQNSIENKVNENRNNSAYMYVEYMTDVRGNGKFSKRLYFFSAPILYIGDFEDSKLRITEEFYAKIEKIVPDVENRTHSMWYTLNYKNSDDLSDKFLKKEDCLSSIKESKESNIKGWGGDPESFENIDIK